MFFQFEIQIKKCPSLFFLFVAKAIFCEIKMVDRACPFEVYTGVSVYKSQVS